MAAYDLILKIKRQTELKVPAANYSYTETTSFLKGARSFVFNVKNELMASGVSYIAKIIYDEQTDVVRTVEISGAKLLSPFWPYSE